MEMRKHKILHIIPTLAFGGAEKICIDLAGQQAKDNEVCICTLRERANSWRVLPNNGIKELTVANSRGRIFCYWNVFKLLAKERPDIVHGHVGGIIYTLLFGIFNLFRRKRIVFVYTFHTLPDKDLTPFHQKILKRQIKYLGVVPVAISAEIKERICDTYGLKPEKVRLVTNGVPLPVTTDDFANVQSMVNSLKLTANTVTYIHVARISAVKNQLLLVNAFNEILRGGADAVLIIIGEVQDQAIFNEIRNLIKDGRIHLLGVKSNVNDFMKCADFLCFTSLYEGLPLAMIEGFANGLVILSTPFSGVGRIITNEQNGLIATGFNTEQYIEIIKKSMELHDDVYNTMSTNAQRTYENLYTLDICVNNYLQIYEGRNLYNMD